MLYDNLKQVFCQKSKKKECVEQISKIVADLKFFKEKREIFDSLLYYQMLKKLNLIETKQEEVLFHYGSNNVELFYIIMQGKVAILCPKNRMISHKQILDEYHSGDIGGSPKSSNDSLRDIIIQQAYSNFLGMKNLKQFDQDAIIDEYNHKPNSFQVDKALDLLIYKRFPSLKIVNMCHQGDQFGEIALIGHVRRTATVLCVTDCLLLTLTNNDFQNILQQYHSQVRNEKIQLLRNYSLFRTLSDSKLKGMIEHIIVQKFSIFSVIYYENTVPEYIYFIKSGEVELVKAVNKTKQISISLLQVGCVFGHQDIGNQQLRQYRAISKSCQCELYLIPVQIVKQFDQNNQNHQAEKEFHQLRLKRLLSDRISPNERKKQNLSPQSIEERYKGDKDYESFLSYAFATKRVLSPKHKKLISEPFVPFFEVTHSKSKKFRQHTSLSKNQSVEKQTTHNLDHINNSKNQLITTQINYHRHLFSPRTTKRHLDTFMPFKRL
ncbi:unnamed protein product [Paramecium sonneborni]|uniref:Cyclic nucleotide-binding domain-containing protein n=1 Tax=Paramecium sonneborni TaxID=65129 RepID=A0A8S1JU96_9CILI|nr:unnamed protein product [Paramecium sonneborni]